MIAELIARVFATRNAAHNAHLRTRSYAQHEALGAFYADVIDAVDTVAEAWMGAFGDLPELPPVDMPGEDILAHLREEADWIEVNRAAIADEYDAIANLVDGITAVYLKAIYKLSRFA